MPGRAARIVNLFLGTWIFLSAFLWSHTPADRFNDWAVGLAIVLCAVVELSSPSVRRANLVLGE
jgi:hypothetical protein